MSHCSLKILCMNIGIHLRRIFCVCKYFVSVKLAVKSPLLHIADFLMAAVTVERTAITFHHHNHAEPVSFSIHSKCCRILHE